MKVAEFILEVCHKTANNVHHIWVSNIHHPMTSSHMSDTYTAYRLCYFSLKFNNIRTKLLVYE